MTNPAWSRRPGMPWRGLWLLILCGLLGACASSPESSRYRMAKDAYPDQDIDVAHIPDAVPRWEPRSRGGNNSPYTVWGKQYHVLDSAEGYRERGVASWYGKKFHGYQTSNGEIYDMYGMSAAHRSLPLPSYVRVTNLENGRSVIVRVNDRGPFHEGRLIDLSYAAAKKLGYVEKGTARVEVEAITPPGGTQGAVQPVGMGSSQPSDMAGMGWFIQVGAFSARESADRLRARLSSELRVPVFVSFGEEAGNRLHRVRVGPFTSEAEAWRYKNQVERIAGEAVVIQRPLTSGTPG